MNNSNSFSVKSVDFFTGNIFATSQTYTSTGSISINDFVKGDNEAGDPINFYQSLDISYVIHLV